MADQSEWERESAWTEYGRQLEARKQRDARARGWGIFLAIGTLLVVMVKLDGWVRAGEITRDSDVRQLVAFALAAGAAFLVGWIVYAVGRPSDPEPRRPNVPPSGDPD